MKSRFITFVAELRERRVFRVAVAYIVVSYAIAQGGAFVFDALNFPEWTTRFVAIALALGLPIAIALSWAFDITPHGLERTPEADSDKTASRLHLLIGFAAVTVVVAFGIAAIVVGGDTSTDSTFSVFELTVPESTTGLPIDLSHGRVVYAGTSGGILESGQAGQRWLRANARPVSKRLELQDLAPDGSALLVRQLELGKSFQSANTSLLVLPFDGGPARVLHSAIGPERTTIARWSDDGFVFALLGQKRVVRIHATTGVIDTLPRVSNELFSVRSLSVLPEGRGIVLGGYADAGRDNPNLVAFDLRKERWVSLGAGGPDVAYVKGGLLYSDMPGAKIVGRGFDLHKLTFVGPAFPFAETTGEGIEFRVTSTMLSYRGLGRISARAELVGILGPGGETDALPNLVRGRTFDNPVVSPNGKLLALTVTADSSKYDGDIYVYQLPAGPMMQLTRDERAHSPAWLPNGEDLSYVRGELTSTEFGPRIHQTLMRRKWDSSSPSVKIVSLERPQRSWGFQLGRPLGHSWQADGSLVIKFQPAMSRMGCCIGRFRPTQPDTIEPLVSDDAGVSKLAVRLADDLVAYESHVGGQLHVFVRSLHNGARRQVSLAWGQDPVWSWSGRSLFFRSDTMIYRATIQAQPGLTVGRPEPVFRASASLVSYTVLPGDTALVVLEASPGRCSAGFPAPFCIPPMNPLIVMVNYQQRFDQLRADTKK